MIIFTLLLVVAPVNDCQAQRNASRAFEKEVFSKRKAKVADNKGGANRAAAKAMKEQEKKEARRDKEDAKQLKALRKQHFENQSASTQERMVNNRKNTETRYKEKKQKIRKEQSKPDLKKQTQPKPQKVKKKAKTRDPKKQPKLKQHKIKKY